MKKIIAILAISIIITSCGSGRWVGGNAKHFQQRKDAKELRDSKSEFVTIKTK